MDKRTAPVAIEQAQAVAIDRASLIDLIEDNLHAVYHCTRVWAAWSVGTMSEDDFHEARGTELAPDLADAIIAKFVASPEAAPAAMDVVWSGWACQYPGKLPRLYGAKEIAELNCDEENGDQLLFLTAAPAATPAAPSAVTMEVLDAVLKSPDTQAKMAELGIELLTGNPTQMSALIRDDLQRWGEVTSAEAAPIRLAKRL